MMIGPEARLYGYVLSQEVAYTAAQGGDKLGPGVRGDIETAAPFDRPLDIIGINNTDAHPRSCRL